MGKTLAEIAGHFTALEPAGGGNLKGTCPFCRHSLPMFQISPDKGLWHCFNCREGGDAAAFILKIRQPEEP